MLIVDLNQTNIEGHIRMGTDLWRCTLMVIFLSLPSHIILFLTLSYPINDKLGSDYQFYKSLV